MRSFASYSFIPYLASERIEQNCLECGIFVRIDALQQDVKDISNIINEKDKEFYAHPDRLLVITWKNVKSYPNSSLVRNY